MNPCLRLAKLATESFVQEGKIIAPPKGQPKDFLEKRAGVFVSIHKRGLSRGGGRALRGCVGTYLPTKDNLAEEIISSAVSASQDPRFLPIKREELPFLTYEVYILDRPELIEDLSELDPKKYGILVKTSDPPKSGLLLPGLEGINTPEQQISIACQKAGINSLKEKMIIYKFTSQKYD